MFFSKKFHWSLNRSCSFQEHWLECEAYFSFARVCVTIMQTRKHDLNSTSVILYLGQKIGYPCLTWPVVFAKLPLVIWRERQTHAGLFRQTMVSYWALSAVCRWPWWEQKHMDTMFWMIDWFMDSTGDGSFMSMQLVQHSTKKAQPKRWYRLVYSIDSTPINDYLKAKIGLLVYPTSFTYEDLACLARKYATIRYVPL